MGGRPLDLTDRVAVHYDGVRSSISAEDCKNVAARPFAIPE